MKISQQIRQIASELAAEGRGIEDSLHDYISRLEQLADQAEKSEPLPDVDLAGAHLCDNDDYPEHQGKFCMCMGCNVPDVCLEDPCAACDGPVSECSKGSGFR